MDILGDVKGASKEELEQFLDEIRASRKKGYEAPKRSGRKAQNPYADLDPEVAKKILEALHESAIKAQKEE